MHTPMSLRRFNRDGLPLFFRRLSGGQLMRDLERVVATDRWNSFDQFRQTTRYVRDRFAEVGARAELYPVPTRGPDGTGRWRLQAAVDIQDATLDLIQPMRRRVVDFRKNPWQVVQGSAATSLDGVESRLIVIDDWDELRRVSEDALRGCWILTRLNPWHRAPEFARTGADGILTGYPVGRGCGRTEFERIRERATPWTKLGWSGLPMEQAGTSLVALAISGEEQMRLRAVIRRHGNVRIRARVDIRRYVGTHDLAMGVVPGWGDPGDEIWILAHSAEPGAADNASGLAIHISAASALERAIRDGVLPRPRRSIRFLVGYECYSFFYYLEQVRRLQPALAGLNTDSLGYHPRYCNGHWNWHATLPASAGFVNDIGESILRAALRIDNPGYRVITRPFMSTDDTLVGDPKYGFPCPWMNMHFKGARQIYQAYHTSADVPALMSPRALRVAAAMTAGYAYYLADADSAAMLDMARNETGAVLADLAAHPRRSQLWARLRQDQHAVSLQRLRRWMWGGERRALLRELMELESAVRRAVRSGRRIARVVPPAPGAERVVFRTRLLAPDFENIPPEARARLNRSGLDRRPLFWADGERTLRQIAGLHAEESGTEPDPAAMIEYFEALAAVGFVKLIPPDQIRTPSRLADDLRALGLKSGMDVMVHSAFSRIGWVRGGANAVIDALLQVIGPDGTLLAPSFNHGQAVVYNPLATPTTNGLLADTLWRRPDAARSLQGTHPVAAIGRRADEYVADHPAAGIWGAESPIGRLVRHGGQVLCLGVSLDAVTVYHIAETAAGGACLSMFGGRDRVVQPDGTVAELPGLLWRDGRCPVPVDDAEARLERRGRLRRGTVGAAGAMLFPAADFYALHRRRLVKVCPTCPRRPDAKWKNAGE